MLQGELAAHADICPALGYEVVGLEKKDGIGGGGGGKGAVADSVVVAAKGRYWVRAPLPRFSQGSKSRDQVGFWVLAGICGRGWISSGSAG